jgi:hypothetical protein
MLQVQQQIAQEYEQVKATTNTLQLFKIDTHVDRTIGEQIECCDKRDWAQVRDVCQVWKIGHQW